jgi:hypothetical protein
MTWASQPQPWVGKGVARGRAEQLERIEQLRQVVARTVQLDAIRFIAWLEANDPWRTDA